jgi:hypothetical protein
MKMVLERRAIDKVWKRRDRYEIPDWQARRGLGPSQAAAADRQATSSACSDPVMGVSDP